MGQVILWPGPESRTERPARDTDGPKGRILLFLGVRYERHDVDGATPTKALTRVSRSERSSRRRKRG